MKKARYTLVVDDRPIVSCDTVSFLKKLAEEHFEGYPYWYYAKIMVGNKIYCSRFSDSPKWQKRY